METWSKYWSEGDAYLKAGIGGWAKTQKFLPEVVFSLGTLAIEAYFLAFLGNRNRLPEHHTFGHFIRAVSSEKPFPTEVAEVLRKLDLKQNLCDFAPHLSKPTFWEVELCLNTAQEVRDFLLSLEPEGVRV